MIEGNKGTAHHPALRHAQDVSDVSQSPLSDRTQLFAQYSVTAIKPMPGLDQQRDIYGCLMTETQSPDASLRRSSGHSNVTEAT